MTQSFQSYNRYSYEYDAEGLRARWKQGSRVLLGVRFAVGSNTVVAGETGGEYDLFTVADF